MVTRHVHVTKAIAASADTVWSMVRDFAEPWHPAVSAMTAEQLATGESARRFTVVGEPTQSTLYCEKLTYFSDADRVMTYEHVAGIEGVQRYVATLSVHHTGAGCTVDWQASLNAIEPRADAIAQGTRQIFEQGCEALRLRCHIETRTITTEGPSLCFDLCGSATNTLCVFLHGIGGGRQNWENQLHSVGHLMQAAAMDFRGYGNSALGAKPSTVDDYCADILRVMAHVGARRVVLCGLSFGAWIATSFAMRHPELVAGLCLAGGCTGMSEASNSEQASFRAAREVPLNAGQSPKDFAPAVVNVIASPHALQAVRDALFASMAAIPAETYRDALRCFTHPPERFDFAKLTMPVLFATGEHDVLASPVEIRGVAQRVLAQSPTPQVGFEIIADAGHVCNLEAPSAFNTLLKNFLGKIAR
jgi:pimeloyl-ACP methyl ester carboxylesterase